LNALITGKFIKLFSLKITGRKPVQTESELIEEVKKLNPKIKDIPENPMNIHPPDFDFDIPEF